MEEVVIEPYKKGFLNVGDGHKLYFELCGNPKGKPVLYLHGGPGSGFSGNAKKYFDPKLWNIILFDQRGSGHSTPFASLEHNTTNDLVDDISKLLNHVGARKVTLFGGSWGSTLALTYAIRNTHKVNGMILRGIYLPGKIENDCMNGSTKQFVPKQWERFISNVPRKERDHVVKYYYEQMQSKDQKIKQQFAYEWAYFEMSLFRLQITEIQIQENLKKYSYQSLAPVEAYYAFNNCFLPKNYLLTNVSKLSGIPTYIIQGKYDLICPPFMAYELSQKIKGSKLFLTIAGHASSEKQTRKKLLWAVRKIYPLV